ARLLELLLQRGRGLLEILHAIGERTLILGYRLRLLGLLVAHRVLLAVGARRAARGVLGCVLERAIARRIARAVLDRLLGLRGRRRLAHSAIRRFASQRPTFLHGRDLQQQLAALAELAPRRVVRRHDL